MTWDIKIKGNDKYLKIGPGESAQIHILSRKPQEEFVHWTEDRKKITCPQRDCNICKSDPKPAKQNWHTNVFDRKDGKVKCYTFGPMIAGQIKDIAEILDKVNSTIHDIDLVIKCKKEGPKTSYMVMQTTKGPEAVTYYDGFNANPLQEETPF